MREKRLRRIGGVIDTDTLIMGGSPTDGSSCEQNLTKDPNNLCAPISLPKNSGIFTFLSEKQSLMIPDSQLRAEKQNNTTMES